MVSSSISALSPPRFTSSSSVLISILVAFTVAAITADASFFKVASVLPTTYGVGAPLPSRVSSLSSITKIVKMPWYSLPWCQISKEQLKKGRKALNLGQLLTGDNVEHSLYDIAMLKNLTCKQVCDPITMDAKSTALLTQRIEENYRGSMLLDGLPVYEHGTGGKNRLSRGVRTGFPVGVPKKYVSDHKTLVNNHLAFIVQYHEQGSGFATDEEVDMHRIVGFKVIPFSIDHDVHKCDENLNLDTATTPLRSSATRITWSYSVAWEESDIEWSTRWDVYLKGSPAEARVHWMAIINSVCVVVLLAVIIAVILVRALRKDLARYNDPDALAEDREETGWKLVHGDVYRKPEQAGLLAVYVGTGTQLISMVGLTLVVSLFGFTSPANRGSLFSALVFVYVLLGSYAGYTTARLAKFFKMKSWKIIFAAAVFFPGQMCLGYLLLNFVHWGYNAATATPFVTILTLLVLWFCVSLPLVLLGGAIGYNRDTIEVPCKVKIIAQAVPPQPWYLQQPWCIILPGILPFGSAFMEVVFILSSMWQGRIYYMFGFLFLVFVILIITCAEATIVMTYFQLVNLDYNWWWRSFLSSGSYGLWLFLYSVVYYIVALSIRSWWSSVLYFGYMFLVSYFFFVLTGTIGFLSAFAFINKIYGSIKVE